MAEGYQNPVYIIDLIDAHAFKVGRTKAMIYVYELRRETPKFIIVMRNSSAYKMAKQNLHWAMSLDEARSKTRAIIDADIERTEKYLAMLKGIDSVEVHEVAKDMPKIDKPILI